MQKNPHPKRSAISIALLALGALAFNPAQATVTDADILNDAATKGDVVSFGLGTQGQRFSPMTQINTKTVKNLVPAWSMSFGGEKQRGQESMEKDLLLWLRKSGSWQSSQGHLYPKSKRQ